MEKIKELAGTKKEGNEFVEASLCMFATMLMLVILGFSYAVWQTQFNLNDKIDLIQTAYMKRIETIGYLTDADKAALTNELEEAGFSNVDLTGSTMAHQEYGQPIKLSISGVIDLADINNLSVISPIISYLRNAFGKVDFGKLDYVNHTFYGTSKN